MIFLKTRFLFLRNKFKKNFAKNPFKVGLAFSFIIFSLWGLYYLILKGLSFLDSLGGVGSLILGKLFYIFFSAIFLMLIISSGILSYICLFRNPESEFFLTLPLSFEKISFNKFFETTVLSSWAFLFLMLPLITAYSQIQRLEFYIPFLSFLYFLPFVLISSFIGFFLCVLVVKYFNLRILGKFTFFVSVGIIFIILIKLKFFTSGSKNVGSLFLSRLIPYFEFSRIPVLPFYWVSEGLKSLEEKSFFKSFVFLSNLWSLAFLFLGFISKIGRKFYLDCFQKAYQLSYKRRIKRSLLDELFEKIKMPRYFKAFVLKDIKLFIRDPLQWSQFLIFFGLLFIYFINLRELSYHLLGDVWKNLITFLNTFSVFCILASLGTRYVFPQLSLEGMNFWILNSAPVSLKKIFLEKFIISFAPSFLISFFLIFISNLMLEIKGFILFIISFIVLIVCFTIMSICTGLGAYFADFTKRHHLEVVSGFGGILTLILNVGYLTFSIVLFASLFHLYLTGKLKIDLNKTLFLLLGIWSLASIILSLSILFAGYRALKKKEF